MRTNRLSKKTRLRAVKKNGKVILINNKNKIPGMITKAERVEVRRVQLINSGCRNRVFIIDENKLDAFLEESKDKRGVSKLLQKSQKNRRNRTIEK